MTSPRLRVLLVMLLCGALALGSQGVASAQPSNDNRADRAVVTLGSTTPFSTVGATDEPGEPPHAGTGQASVWFSLAADGGPVEVDTIVSDFDTVIAVYTDDGAGGLAEVTSNDDVDGQTHSRVLFDGVSGVEYLIAVAGFGGETGTGQLNVHAGVAGGPAPDGPAIDAVAAALTWSVTYPAGSVAHVLIGRDDVFADNLSSGGLQDDAVLLLTPGDRLDARVTDEIRRLGATKVTILGGAAAISADVEAELGELVADVTRLSGGARWDTAVSVARETGATTAILARAFDADGGSGTAAWADSVSAGAWAASEGLALLLTPSDQLVGSVADFLAEGQITRVVIVGGGSAISAEVEAAVRALVPDTTRVSGPDRGATSVAIANARTGQSAVPEEGAILILGFDPLGWSGGVSAGAPSARDERPVVLTNSDGVLPPAVEAWLGNRVVTALDCGPGMPESACVVAHQHVRILPPGAAFSLGALPDVLPGPYNADYFARPDTVGLVGEDDGSLSVVTLDRAGERVVIRRYQPDTGASVGEPVTLSTVGWPKWGGMLAAGGHRFLLVGRDNPAEDPAFDTIEVRRYTSTWEFAGTATFANDAGGVYEAFAATAPDMLLVGDTLFVHAARTLFVTDDGLHHQANLTIRVDVPSMVASEFTGRPYSSHSFNQLLATGPSGDDLVFLDHGDAFPRALQLGLARDVGAAEPPPVETFPVMAFNGGLGDDFYQYTGTAATGMASGPSGVVIVGNSVVHTGDAGTPVDKNENRNAFVITFDPADGGSELRWLTDFPRTGGPTVSDPRMVPLGSDRFAVLFGVTQPDGSQSLAYRLIDSAGTVLAASSWAGTPFLSVGELVLVGDHLVWASLSCCQPDAYVFSLDLTDPAAPQLG